MCWEGMETVGSPWHVSLSEQPRVFQSLSLALVDKAIGVSLIAFLSSFTTRTDGLMKDSVVDISRPLKNDIKTTRKAAALCVRKKTQTCTTFVIFPPLPRKLCSHFLEENKRYSKTFWQGLKSVCLISFSLSLSNTPQHFVPSVEEG